MKMTTSPPSRIHGRMTDEWSPKVSDHRKTSSQTTGCHWQKEVPPKTTSFTGTGSRIYQQACGCDHEINYMGARTSEESECEPEDTRVDKNTLKNNESVYVNIAPRPDNLAIKYPRFAHYDGNYAPEAILAVQKLRKLKELQIKRDMSERYYTHAIKRLIGEYYMEAKTLASSVSPQREIHSASFPPYAKSRVKNSLEPCGTMTTITKLDCGCIQETARPIFTTTRGRVQRWNCNQSQEEMFLKSTPLNPQEHLFATIEQRSDRPRSSLKKRPDIEAKAYAKISEDADRVCETETENEMLNEAGKPKIAECVSRASSPYENYSDAFVGSA
ncbi:uncharacterized protein LOC143258996 [Megalopta genalis]|uniref:uncharacterized protein LOC143258996 n=1 Tax=Megalopta genalis TaxID=115081 RepID=UPI003FCEEC83